MMSISQVRLEAWVLALYDTVVSGSRVEDARAELKADWPEPAKAARRIAGHLNAARGEDVLWVIGLDEARGVSQLDDVDTADWWAQVCRHFDGAAPSLTDVVVRTEDGPVQALMFDASRSPFTVRNPAFGQSSGGPVEREVPWREGTRVRSATREDLIRLLVPLQQLPDVEILTGRATASIKPAGNAAYAEPTDGFFGTEHLEWSVELEMYVTPALGTLVVLPVHRTTILFRDGDGTVEWLTGSGIRYWAPYTWGANSSRPDSVSVDATSSEAIVQLPGRVHVRASCAEELRDPRSGSPLLVRFAVIPVHSGHTIQLEAILRTVADPGAGAEWRLADS